MKNYSRLGSVLSLFLGFLLLIYVIQRIGVDRTLESVRAANVAYLAGALLLLVLAYLTRAVRWTFWDPTLTLGKSFQLLLIGFMGNNLLPVRGGEVLRVQCLSYGRGKSDYTGGIASVATEHALDGVAVSSLSFLGLFFVHVDSFLFLALLSISGAIVLSIAGLVLGACFHRRTRGVIEAVNRLFPGHLTAYGKLKIGQFLDELLNLGGLKVLIKASGLTAVTWVLEAVSCYLLFLGVAGEASIGECFVVLAVVNIASLFPLTAGGIGVTEGVASAYLISAGVPPPESLAIVMTMHAYQFTFTTIGGGLSYLCGGWDKALVREREAAKGTALRPGARHTSEIMRQADRGLRELRTDLGIGVKPSEKIDLSIVIPAFNEQNRLPRTLLETLSWCKKSGYAHEVVVVDDGSSDGTWDLAMLFSNQVEGVRCIAIPHLGKGAAVKIGMLNSLGKYVLFMDADGATGPSEIARMISKSESGFDIVIGSRVPQAPHEVEIEARLHRRIMGRIFAALVNIFAVPGFGDTQCGFKMFRQEVIRLLFPLQRINGFAFDVELLYLARKLSISTVEVPVNWVHKEGSRINLVTDSVKMMFDVLRIKWVHRGEVFGRYSGLNRGKVSAVYHGGKFE